MKNNIKIKNSIFYFILEAFFGILFYFLKNFYFHLFLFNSIIFIVYFEENMKQERERKKTTTIPPTIKALKLEIKPP